MNIVYLILMIICIVISLVYWIKSFVNVIIKEKQKEYWDDSQLDATDAAHPAWWRGENYGCYMSAKLIANILSGKETGKGIMNEPVETMRKSVIKLKQERDELLKEEQNCFILLNKYKPDISGGPNLDWQIEKLLRNYGTMRKSVIKLKQERDELTKIIHKYRTGDITKKLFMQINELLTKIRNLLEKE